MMNSQAHSPPTSIVITRCSPHSVCKSHPGAHASNAPSLTLLRWGCVSQRTCFSSTLKASKKIVHLGRNGNSRRYCHHSHGRIAGKVTVPSPAAVLASRDSIPVSKWRTALNCPWIFQSWQQLLRLVSSAKSSSGCWIRDCAGATVTVLFVQAITAQDISPALSLTPPILREPRLQQLVDFTISPCTKSGSISRWGARLSSVSCGAKKLPTGRTSPLLGLRPYATPTIIGSSITRQGRGKPGFEGFEGRGVGGQPMAAKAPSIALKVSSSASVAVITSTSLTSPLAAIVNAGSHLDLNVLRASFTSSLNLISLCYAIVVANSACSLEAFLVHKRSGQLSAETPVVLSQVAFRVLIPCFLMTKVAVTLASHPTASLLVLPLIAIAQVLVGALLGKAACRFVYGKPSTFVLPTLEASLSQSSGSAPPITSSQKESVIIVEVEKPLSTFNFSRRSQQYMTAKREAIVTAACAFGNSFTLPLIFMTGVLGVEETSKIAGYLAIFMVGWSPAFWTVGYSIIATGDEKSDVGESSPKHNFSWTTLVEGFKRIMNPPLYGVLIGMLVGGTPLSHLFLPVANGGTMSMQATGALGVLGTSTAGILRPVFDAATLLGTATLAVQTIVLASSLGASLPPPETGRDAKRASRAAAMEAVLNPPEPGAELDSVLDTRAFWIISSVRLVAMPVIVIISTVILQCARILPIDPVYNLLLLAESAMPSAQNLVLLSQLGASTRRLSGVLASLLLRQYAISIIPITFWMALFLAIVQPA